MCNNHPAPTSPWLIQAHQCTYCNIACLPANLSEHHTTVSGFRGNTIRATHRGDFNCVVRAQSGRLIHLVDPSAALVIPDSHRNLYSVRHAQHSGRTVILGAQAKLLPYGDPDLFNHSALNTEILQPPVKPVFSHNSRFNANTDVFNENGRFAKNFHRQETSALPQSSQEHHSTMVRSRLHWASQARHNLWLCRRMLCRSNTLISRIRLHAQRSCYFLARQ